MKRRFPILAYGMRVKTETAMKIISACAVLHNICIDANEAEPLLPEGEEIGFRRLLIDAQMDAVAIPDNNERPPPNRHRRNARDVLMGHLII